MNAGGGSTWLRTVKKPVVLGKQMTGPSWANKILLLIFSLKEKKHENHRQATLGP